MVSLVGKYHIKTHFLCLLLFYNFFAQPIPLFAIQSSVICEEALNKSQCFVQIGGVENNFKIGCIAWEGVLILK